MSVNIHGKEYITVSERLEMAKGDLLSITTEVLYQEPVVIKASIVTKKGTFTGISAANPAKVIEKTSPYEVAETSAIGRALGFAGYGITNGIATADEIKKADNNPDWIKEADKQVDEKFIGGKCIRCGQTVSDKVAKYSADKFKEVLCYKCQKLVEK